MIPSQAELEITLRVIRKSRSAFSLMYGFESTKLAIHLFYAD